MLNNTTLAGAAMAVGMDTHIIHQKNSVQAICVVIDSIRSICRRLK